MDKESCELCGGGTSLMTVAIALVVQSPVGIALVSGVVCFSCWAKFPGDELLAEALLKRRADKPKEA